MAVFAQELKKLFRLRLSIAYCLAFTGLLIVLTVSNYASFIYPITHQPAPQPNVPESITYARGSSELLFTDMLLKEYGTAIEKSDLPRFREQTEQFCNQLRKAVQMDSQLQDAHMVLDDNWRIQSSPEPETDKGDLSHTFDYTPYVWSCISGDIQLTGTDYPVAFAGMMQELLQTLEEAANTESTVLYRVSIPSSLTSEIANLLMPVLYTALCGLAILIPYAILENRSHTPQVLCTSRIGRKIEYYRLGALGAGACTITAIGIVCSVILLNLMDIERYYPLAASTNDEAFSAYTGSTFLGLFIQLALFTGIACLISTLIAVLIASRLHNIVTAFACALLPFFLLCGCYLFYVVLPIIGERDHFLFAGEPWAVLAGLALLLTAAVAAHLIHIRRCEIR